MARTKVEKKEAVDHVVESEVKDNVENPIPDNVLRLLKAFSNMEVVYITPNGGVFQETSPKALIEKAVLYKNPYYKK